MHDRVRCPDHVHLAETDRGDPFQRTFHLAYDPLLSEDPLRRARFQGNRWRVDRFQVSIGQKVMAKTVLWNGSRSKGLEERFGSKPSV
jgi:hypothetical protein